MTTDSTSVTHPVRCWDVPDLPAMADWVGVLLSAGHGRERRERGERGERAKAEVGAYFTAQLAHPRPSGVVVGTLLARLPRLRLAAPGGVRWQRGALIRGPETLPVAW